MNEHQDLAMGQDLNRLAAKNDCGDAAAVVVHLVTFPYAKIL
jgi:hypothetical protein